MNDAVLSIIIVAHNAAPTLAPLVEACLALLRPSLADIEVVIVDDASADETPRIADRLAATLDPVVVLHQRARTGYGAALAQGIAAARGDVIAALPANAPRAADDLARLVPALQRADVVVGVPRYLAGETGGVWRDWPRGAERGPLLARADVLRAIPFTSTSQLAHPEIAFQARRSGHAVALVALPEAGSRRESFGTTVAALRLKVQAGRNRAIGVSGRPWQQKALLGGALAALLGGAWVALRRR